MDILGLLKSFGGLLTGHFVLKSGRHSDTYLNKDVLYPYYSIMSQIGQEFAKHAPSAEVVIGPATGGIILSQWTAFHLLAKSLYSENGVIKRNAHLIGGSKVLLVEDIVTTGGSIGAVGTAVEALGGTIVGGICMVNRGDYEFPSLAKISIDSWLPEECPLCKQNIPFNVDVGHAVLP